jgi:CRISPR system Cascade subunit CasC
VLRVGAATEPLAALGTDVTLDGLLDAVGAAVADRLEKDASSGGAAVVPAQAAAPQGEEQPA